MKFRSQIKKAAPFFALIAGCMWGVIGVYVRYFQDNGIDGSSSVGIRSIGAVIIFAIIILFSDKNKFKFKIKDLWIFLATGIFSGIGINFFYNLAIEDLSFSLAAVLLSTMPVFVIIFSYIFFKEKITKLKFISMFLVFTGCVLVSGVFGGGIKEVTIPGIIFGLLAGIGYAFYSITAKVASNYKYDPLTVNLYSFIVAAVIFSIFTDWNAVGNYIAADVSKTFIILLCHSFFCVVAPYILYSIALKYLEAGIAAIFASIEPVAAMISGAIFENEIPTIITVVGVFVVLSAIIILGVSEKTGDNYEQIDEDQKIYS